MPLLVDTYNVLHTTGVLPPDLAGLDVEGLAEQVRVSRYGREIVYLICDGSPRERPAADPDGRVRIRFAGPSRVADDVIARMIRQSSAPRRLTVVSSDRAVLREARRRRCRTITSDQFLAQLARDAERRAEAPPTVPDAPIADTLDDWLEAFGISPEELEHPAAAPPAPPEEAAPEPPPASPPGGASAPPPSALEAEVPDALILEAEAMEAEYRAALEAAPDEAPDPDAPAPAAEPETEADAPESRPRSHADAPVLPPSIIEEAEGLLHRDAPPDG